MTAEVAPATSSLEGKRNNYPCWKQILQFNSMINTLTIHTDIYEVRRVVSLESSDLNCKQFISLSRQQSFSQVRINLQIIITIPFS